MKKENPKDITCNSNIQATQIEHYKDGKHI